MLSKTAKIHIHCCRKHQKFSNFVVLPSLANTLLYQILCCLRYFKYLVELIEDYGGDIANDTVLINYETAEFKKTLDLVALTDIEINNAILAHDIPTVVKNKLLAVAFLRRADRARYGDLLRDLRNSYARGRDEYPTTLDAAFQMMQSYVKPAAGYQQRSSSTITGGLQYAQQESTNTNIANTNLPSRRVVPGINGRTYHRIRCHSCNDFGHYSNQCPIKQGEQHAMDAIRYDAPSDASSDDSTDLILEFTYVHRNLSFTRSCKDILIDSGSTCSVFCDADLLENISGSAHTLRAVTNGGYQDSNQRGSFPDFFDVWFNSDCMLNILAWCDVSNHFRITTDLSVAHEIYVHIGDGAVVTFRQVETGLFLMDLESLAVARSILKSPKPKDSVISYSYATLVSENKKSFARREIEGVDNAKSLFRSHGMPSYQAFIEAIENNHIHDCPVTAADVKRCVYIYGPEIAILKGKTKRKQPIHVPHINSVPLPKSISDHHSIIDLYVDFFYVHGIPFLHSISECYQFRTVEATRGRTKTDMLTGLRKILHVYNNRNIKIRTIHADNEFSCISNDLSPLLLNVTPAGDHVPSVERSIQTIKNNTRTIIHSLPFKYYPTLLLEGCVYNAVRLLNILPSKNGISESLSPTTLVTGKPPPKYNDLVKLSFGDYAQVYVGTKNNMESRTVGGIAISPTGNVQHSWYFLSLETGKKYMQISIPYFLWINVWLIE